MSHVLPHGDPVHKVSIVSRGMALGYTWSMPARDKMLHSKEQFMDEIAGMLGGRVAEKLIFNETTTGASNDLQRVSALARQMVTKFGMSEKLGPIVFGAESESVFLGRQLHESRNYSDAVAGLIDEEVKRIVEEGEIKATRVLKDHMKELKAVTAKLMEVETLAQEEFEKFFEK